MTKKNREASCINCGKAFNERPSESNYQWENRMFCSMSCNNSSAHRVTSIFQRLDGFVEKNDGCWGWNGAKDGSGYGIISSRKGGGFAPEKAHRVSFEKCYGEIPQGMNVCHHCDNPQCTNPEHLFIGTQKDNMIDCSLKGRLNPKSIKNLIPGASGYRGAAVKSNKVELVAYE